MAAIKRGHDEADHVQRDTKKQVFSKNTHITRTSTFSYKKQKMDIHHSRVAVPGKEVVIFNFVGEDANTARSIVVPREDLSKENIEELNRNDTGFLWLVVNVLLFSRRPFVVFLHVLTLEFFFKGKVPDETGIITALALINDKGDDVEEERDDLDLSKITGGLKNWKTWRYSKFGMNRGAMYNVLKEDEFARLCYLFSLYC